MAGAGFMTLRSLDLEPMFAAEHAIAKSMWDTQRKEWMARAGSARFEVSKTHYLRLAATHSELPAQEQAQLKALEQKKRQLQMQKHMESHLIERAKIPASGLAARRPLHRSVSKMRGTSSSARLRMSRLRPVARC